MMGMIEELHKFDRCIATESAKIPSVSVHFAWSVRMLCCLFFWQNFPWCDTTKDFSTKLNGFSKFVVSKWHTVDPLTNEICWYIYVYMYIWCVSMCCMFVCVFTTMCDDIQSKLWNITYKAWFMSHFKLVFRWFWLIYRSFSCVMPLLPSPRQLCTHIAGNHELTSNKCSVFQLPFNNGTCILGISHVSLLLQGVYTVHCILRSKTWHFNLLFKELSM